MAAATIPVVNDKLCVLRQCRNSASGHFYAHNGAEECSRDDALLLLGRAFTGIIGQVGGRFWGKPNIIRALTLHLVTTLLGLPQFANF